MCLLLGERALLKSFEGEQEKPESLQNWTQNLSPRCGLQFLQWSPLCLLLTLSMFFPSFLGLFHGHKHSDPKLRCQRASLSPWSNPEGESRYLSYCSATNCHEPLCIHSYFHGKREVIQLCWLAHGSGQLRTIWARVLVVLQQQLEEHGRDRTACLALLFQHSHARLRFGNGKEISRWSQRDGREE